MEAGGVSALNSPLSSRAKVFVRRLGQGGKARYSYRGGLSINDRQPGWYRPVSPGSLEDGIFVCGEMMTLAQSLEAHKVSGFRPFEQGRGRDRAVLRRVAAGSLRAARLLLI